MDINQLRKGATVKIGADFSLTVEAAAFFHFNTAGQTLGLFVVLDAEGNMAFEAHGYGGPKVSGYSIGPKHLPCDVQEGEEAAIVPDTKAMMTVAGSYFKANRRGERGLFAIDEAHGNWLFGCCGVEATAATGKMPFAGTNWQQKAQFVMLIGEFDTKRPARKGYLAFFNGKAPAVVAETGWVCNLTDEDMTVE